MEINLLKRTRLLSHEFTLTVLNISRHVYGFDFTNATPAKGEGRLAGLFIIVFLQTTTYLSLYSP